MRILEEDNRNWYGAMMAIWTLLTKETRLYLRLPLEDDVFEQYMLRIGPNRTTIAPVARDRYPYIKPIGQQSTHGKEEGYKGNSQSFFKITYRDRDRDRGNRDRNRIRNKDRDKAFDRDRYKSADGSKDYNKRGKGRNDTKSSGNRDNGRDGNRDQAHCVASDSGDSDDDSDGDGELTPSQSEADIVCIVIKRQLICHKCHHSFESIQAKEAHSASCKPFKAAFADGIRTPSPTDPARHTCGYCREQEKKRRRIANLQGRR